MTLFIYFICNLLVSILVIKLYFSLANRFNIIDKPNERSSHSRITIRGGLVVFPIMAIPLLIYWKMLPVAIGLALISGVSLWDDISPLKARVRLIFHFVSFALILVQLHSSIPFFWLYPVIFIFCVGAINAYNFMDGVNGITGLYSIVILISVWWHYSLHPSVKMLHQANELLWLCVPIVVFLFYNFRKRAKTFAGDVGSVSLAFIVVLLLLQLILAERSPIYIFLMGLYGIDSILTLAQRAVNKENIFKPHRKHFYQILANERRIDHRIVAMGYASLQLVLNAALINIKNESDQWIFVFAVYGLITFGYFPTKRHLKNKASLSLN